MRGVNRHDAERQPLVADIDKTLGAYLVGKLRRAGKAAHAREQIVVGRRVAAGGDPADGRHAQAHVDELEPMDEAGFHQEYRTTPLPA